MNFLITNVGMAAVSSANSGGPDVNIEQFKVWEVTAAYTPSVTDTESYIDGLSVGGTEHHTAPTIGYKVIDPNTVQYTVNMDTSVGTFDFNVLGLFHNTGSGYVLFAVAKLDSMQRKVAVSPSTAGNSIALNAKMNTTNLAAAISFPITSPDPANFLTIDSPDLMPLPSATTVNCYVVDGTGTPYGRDNEGNSLLAIRQDNDYWTFATHLHAQIVGTVSASTTTGLDSVDIANLLSGMTVGQYILVVTSGAHKGLCRMVTATSNNHIDWYTSTGTAIAAGTTFKILISNVTFTGAGGTGGQNQYQLVVSSGQATFNVANIDMRRALVFIGAAYQPPSVYTVDSSNQITFSFTVPSGERVHFVERSQDFNNVIPGGSTGQVIVKSSATDGDYVWSYYVPVPGGAGGHLRSTGSSATNWAWEGPDLATTSSLGSTDLNSATTPGKFYYGSSATNKPSANAGLLEVWRESSSVISQHAQDSTTALTYVRSSTNSGSTWTSWIAYAKLAGDSSQTFNVANATTSNHAVNLSQLNAAISGSIVQVKYAESTTNSGTFLSLDVTPLSISNRFKVHVVAFLDNSGGGTQYTSYIVNRNSSQITIGQGGGSVGGGGGQRDSTCTLVVVTPVSGTNTFTVVQNEGSGTAGASNPHTIVVEEFVP